MSLNPKLKPELEVTAKRGILKIDGVITQVVYDADKPYLVEFDQPTQFRLPSGDPTGPLRKNEWFRADELIIRDVTPARFKIRMEKVAATHTGDREAIEGRGTDLMIDVLESLGFHEGIEVFKKALNW